VNRILEPEVMSDPAGAAAYARADFAEVNQGFVDALLARFPELRSAPARALDLGCGPADIPLRLARSAPRLSITAVDASPAMLALGREALAASGLGERVRLLEGRLPGLPLPEGGFDLIFSNSLTHHLPDPAVFWSELRRLGRTGCAVYVMDLYRPESPERAREIVRAAAAQEHPLLQEDFYNSLLAAFSLEELRGQLAAAGLYGRLSAELVSERHWLACGRL